MVKKYIKIILIKLIILLIPSFKAEEGNSTACVSTLLCHKNVNNFILTLSSFYYQIPQALPVYIIDDGTLTDHDKKKLNYFFSTTIVSGNKQNSSTLTSNHKHLAKYLNSNKSSVLKMKFYAFFQPPFKKIIYIDSDILFFKKPNKIIKFIRENNPQSLFTLRNKNAHFRTPELLGEEYYSLRKLFKMHFSKSYNDFRPYDESNIYFNSGLLCISKKNRSTYYNLLDKCFELFETIFFEEEYLCEEISLMLTMNPKRSIPLNTTEYLVASFWNELETIDHKHPPICIHYSADKGLKDKFLSDSIKLSIKQNFFR
jgi:hypothetical protein